MITTISVTCLHSFNQSFIILPSAPVALDILAAQELLVSPKKRDRQTKTVSSSCTSFGARYVNSIYWYFYRFWLASYMLNKLRTFSPEVPEGPASPWGPIWPLGPSGPSSPRPPRAPLSPTSPFAPISPLAPGKPSSPCRQNELEEIARQKYRWYWKTACIL